MISAFQKKMILVGIFTYLLFYQIDSNEYHLMVILSLITVIVSHIFIKENIYEVFDNSVQFTEEEEEARRQEQLEAEGETSSTTGEATTGEATTGEATTGEASSDVPVASNTAFVSAEYVRLRDEARKKDGELEITEPDEKKPVLTENDSPEGTGPTEPEGVSDKKMFQEKDEVKMKPVDDKFRMGPYDGLCISSDKFMENNIVDNDELVTYFGFQIPPTYVTSQDILKGPTVDGTDKSPQKLTMFANNKTSLNCCGESPFMTSTGCVCLTDNQRKFIQSRGFNKSEGDF